MASFCLGAIARTSVKLFFIYIGIKEIRDWRSYWFSSGIHSNFVLRKKSPKALS